MNDALSYYYYTPTFNVLYTLQEFGGYVCCVVNHMPFVIFPNLQNVQHCSVIFPVFLSQIWALVLNQNKIWCSNLSPSSPLAGMATEVWLPSPHRTRHVCPAIGPNHALSSCCHAACLRAQCHRDTGWENQGVSVYMCGGRTCANTNSWAAHALPLGH